MKEQNLPKKNFVGYVRLRLAVAAFRSARQKNSRTNEMTAIDARHHHRHLHLLALLNKGGCPFTHK